MDESEIGWTDGTKNFWAGCTKVTEACKNCYAADRTGRLGFVEWGPKAKRRMIKTVEASVWKAERQAIAEGRMLKQFVNSWSDFFEDRDEVVDARQLAYRLMAETTHLIWILLTKRPEKIEKLIPETWRKNGWPSNVWLGVTAENQKRADERIPILLQHQAAVRFVSAEPLLGPIDLSEYIHALQWVIVGGESGDPTKADLRPMEVAWARGVRDQCVEAGVPLFFKQWGNYEPGADGALVQLRVKRRGSAKLDGETWEQFPRTVRSSVAPARDEEASAEEDSAGEPDTDDEAVSTDADDDVDPEPEADAEPTADSEVPDDDVPHVGADPRDAATMEKELAGLLSRLMDDMSKIARIRLNGRAKVLYETLHPETRHGGDRSEQVLKNRTWPSYAAYAAAQSGLDRSTIAKDITLDEELAELDPEAEEAAYGSRLANRIEFLRRTARIPKKTIHRDLVNIFKNAGPKKAKAELEKWEDTFGIPKPGSKKPDEEQEADAAAEEQPDEAGTTETQTTSEAAPGDDTTATTSDDDSSGDLALIYDALSVTTTPDALATIGGLYERVDALQTELDRLRIQADKLQSDRDMLLQGGPIAEILKLLKVPTTKKAVEAIRAMQGPHAA